MYVEGCTVYRNVQRDKPRVFSTVVLNAAQIDGLPALEVMAPASDRRERAEAVLAAPGFEIRHDQAGRVSSRPATDRIHLPPGAASRPRTPTCHGPARGAHSTVHPSRLDRDLAYPFGSVGYAKEEIRTEIASLMIGDQLGIGQDTCRYAAYAKSWVQGLQGDLQEVLRASRDADKITGYVLGLEMERLPTNMEKLPQLERLAAPKKAERQPTPRRVRAVSGRDR